MAACASRVHFREEDSTDDAPDAKRMRAPSPLLDLPEDLLGTVAGYLTDPSDLDRFARLQRSFYHAVAVHGPLVQLHPLRISKLNDLVEITKGTMRHVREIKFSRMHNPWHEGLRDWHDRRVSCRDVALNHMSMMIGNMRSLSIDGESPFATTVMSQEILPMAKELERVRLSPSADTYVYLLGKSSYHVPNLQEMIDAVVELVTHHKLRSVHIGSATGDALDPRIPNTFDCSWTGLLLNQKLVDLSLSGMRLFVDRSLVLQTMDHSMRHFTLSNSMISDWPLFLAYLGATSKLETLHIDTTMMCNVRGDFLEAFLAPMVRPHDSYLPHLHKLVLNRVTTGETEATLISPNIANLVTLRHLSLNQLCVTDAALRAICASMPYLAHLELDSSRVTVMSTIGNAPFCTRTLYHLIAGAPALETLSLKNVRREHDRKWPNYEPQNPLPPDFLSLLVAKPHMKNLCLAGSDLLQDTDLCGPLLDLESLDVTKADHVTWSKVTLAVMTSLQYARSLRVIHVDGLLDVLHAHRLLGMTYPEKSIQIVGLDAASKMLPHSIREKLAKMYG
jgi:hypothetical protein